MDSGSDAPTVSYLYVTENPAAYTEWAFKLRSQNARKLRLRPTPKVQTESG
jgi:hypothetical protein